jgi:hypothetical protein
MYSQTDDVAKAHPRIVETVETMVRKGKWSVPGMTNPVAFYGWPLDLFLCNRVQGEVWRPQCRVDYLVISIEYQHWAVSHDLAFTVWRQVKS